jgi:hypothetical protein
MEDAAMPVGPVHHGRDRKSYGIEIAHKSDFTTA